MNDVFIAEYRAQIGLKFRALVYGGITAEQLWEDTRSTDREAAVIRDELAKLDDDALKRIVATDPRAEDGNEMYLGMSARDTLLAKATNAVFAAMEGHFEGTWIDE